MKSLLGFRLTSLFLYSFLSLCTPFSLKWQFYIANKIIAKSSSTANWPRAKAKSNETASSEPRYVNRFVDLSYEQQQKQQRLQLQLSSDAKWRQLGIFGEEALGALSQCLSGRAEHTQWPRGLPTRCRSSKVLPWIVIVVSCIMPHKIDKRQQRQQRQQQQQQQQPARQQRQRGTTIQQAGELLAWANS